MSERHTTLIIALMLAASAAIASPRSAAVKAEFRRLHACPITGEHKGPCPGFEIDHVHALVCGGRDEVDNLQWLPVDDHREKTRRDMKGCRTRPK